MAGPLVPLQKSGACIRYGGSREMVWMARLAPEDDDESARSNFLTDIGDSVPAQVELHQRVALRQMLDRFD